MKGFNHYRSAVAWAIALVVVAFMVVHREQTATKTSRSETAAATTDSTPLKRSDDFSSSNNDNDGDDSDYTVGTTNHVVVKVFILAGQSNMVGMASIEHLKELINNKNASSSSSSSSWPLDIYDGNDKNSGDDDDDDDDCDENEYCKALWNVETQSFKIRNDVFMKYEKAQGNLTVGHDFASHNRFGPELGFGWVVGDGLASIASDRRKAVEEEKNKKEYVYIIKTAWGGRTLAIDFRPPASGEGEYTSVKPSKYGWEYRDMVTEIQEGLDQIANVVPGYIANDTSWSYEIAGFVWFQGWNDMLKMPFVQEYGYNLANFMRDVRKEIDRPNLPFIVGELGMHGLHYNGTGAERVQRLRAAQKAVTLLPEFKDSSMFVRTAPYAVQDGKTYGGNYHYNGRADTYFHIGKAFGRAMLKLMENGKQKTTSKATGTAADADVLRESPQLLTLPVKVY